MDQTTRTLLAAGSNALQQHEFEAALALADSAEQHAPNAPGVPFLRGRIYSELALIEKADSAYRRVAELDPDYRGLWHNLGNNAFRRNEYSKAIAYYEKELEKNPDAGPWRGIGRAYQELGVNDSAKYALDKAIALDSTYAAAHVSMAQILEDEGNFGLALQHAQQALALNQNDVEAYYRVGSLLVKQGQNEEALRHLAVVAKEWPWHHGALYNLGQAMIRLGRQEEGKEMLERSEKLRALQAKITSMEAKVRNSPTDPYAHAGLASMLRRAGRYNDAMHAYRVALYLYPQNLEFQNNVAVLHLLRGNPDAASQWFREIVQQDSTFVDAWMNLGVVAARAGRKEEARYAWNKTLQYKPGNPEALAYLARLDQDL